MRASTSLILILFSAAVAADTVVPVDEVETYVRIRSAPDASAEAVSRLHKSKPRLHVRTLEGWYEVDLDDGTTGFVSSDWSVLVADEDGHAVEAPASDEAETVAETTEETVAPVASVDEPVPADERPKPEMPAEPPVAAQPSEPTPDELPDPPVAIAPVVEEPPAKPAQALAASAIPAGPPGPQGPAGPPGPPGDGALKGTKNFLVKFKKQTLGANSQVYDDGNRVGIGTTEPEQRLDVNGSLQINDRTSTVAGLMITQIGGETGYILHNQASTLTIGAGSIDRITIDKDGNIGFGVNRPEFPLQLASGAYVSAGGVWTNSSSRERKENIERLTLEDALAALSKLDPVEFNYRSDEQETHLGFIAEDVPDLVATTDRKSLSPMDIVAVLTRVVQDQQEQIRKLERRIAERD